MMCLDWSSQLTESRLASCSALTLTMHLLILLNSKHVLAFVRR